MMKQILNEWKSYLAEQHTNEMSPTDYIRNFIISKETNASQPNLAAYQDSAENWTIGYGSTKMPDGRAVQPTDTIEPEQAKDAFNKGINQAAIDVNKYVNKNLNQNQFDALVSLLYNLGGTKFFESSIRNLINNNPKDPKIKQEFLLYNKDSDKKVQPGLTARRAEEARIYFTPVGKSLPYVEVPNSSSSKFQTQTMAPTNKVPPKKKTGK